MHDDWFLQLTRVSDEAPEHLLLLFPRRMVIVEIQPNFPNRDDSRGLGGDEQRRLQLRVARLRVVGVHANSGPHVRPLARDGHGRLRLLARAHPDADEPSHAGAARARQHFVRAFREVLRIQVAVGVDQHWLLPDYRARAEGARAWRSRSSSQPVAKIPAKTANSANFAE